MSIIFLISIIAVLIFSGAVIVFASDRDSKLKLIIEPELKEEVIPSALTEDMDIGVDVGPVKSHKVFVVRLRPIKNRSVVEETLAKYPKATLINIETTSDETVMSFEQWE